MRPGERRRSGNATPRTHPVPGVSGRPSSGAQDTKPFSDSKKQGVRNGCEQGYLENYQREKN